MRLILFPVILILTLVQCRSSSTTTLSYDNTLWIESPYGLLYYSAKDESTGIPRVEFGGLYFLDLATKEEKHLTEGSIISWADGFSWSPITRKLIYGVRGSDPFNTQQSELHVLDFEGGKTQLTDNNFNDSDGIWSPDGKMIAFWSNRSDKWLYLMNPDGSDVRPVFEGEIIDFSFFPFAWSPDSQKLAISTVQAYGEPVDLNNLPYGLQIMDVTEGQLIGPIPDDRIRADFSWSFNSDKLVYTSDPIKISQRQTLYTSLYILDIDTQEDTFLTQFAAVGPPQWSPVEDKIAFIASTEAELYSVGQFDVYIINSDGTGLEQLTNTGSYNIGSWSPDGKLLALEYLGQELTDQEIYIFDLEHNVLEQITNNNVLDAYPIWVEK